MSMTKKSVGLIAAPFTPFHPDRSVNLDAIPAYAQWLHQQGVIGAFICGTTGEGSSMTIEERKQVAERWVESAPEGLRIIVHVGHVCLTDCCELARHAQKAGADSIACLSPYFFRPVGEEGLVDWCRHVAAASPELPFYYYHIPSMTGLDIQVSRFLELADKKIPNLVGVKFTHDDLDDLRRCLQAGDRRFDILFGRDEILLSVVRLGVTAAVGSTYNFAAPVYQSMIAAHQAKDEAKAEQLQQVASDMIDWLAQCGGTPLAAFKRFMSRLAIDCGPTRAPILEPTDEQFEATWNRIEKSPLPKLLTHWRSMART